MRYRCLHKSILNGRNLTWFEYSRSKCARLEPVLEGMMFNFGKIFRLLVVTTTLALTAGACAEFNTPIPAPDDAYDGPKPQQFDATAFVDMRYLGNKLGLQQSRTVTYRYGGRDTSKLGILMMGEGLRVTVEQALEALFREVIVNDKNSKNYGSHHGVDVVIQPRVTDISFRVEQKSRFQADRIARMMVTIRLADSKGGLFGKLEIEAEGRISNWSPDVTATKRLVLTRVMRDFRARLITELPENAAMKIWQAVNRVRYVQQADR